MSNGETGETLSPPVPPPPPPLSGLNNEVPLNSYPDNSGHDNEGFDSGGRDSGYLLPDHQRESSFIDDDVDPEYVNVAPPPDDGTQVVPQEANMYYEDEDLGGSTEENFASHDTSFDDQNTQITTISSSRQVRFKEGQAETIGHSEPDYHGDDLEMDDLGGSHSGDMYRENRGEKQNGDLGGGLQHRQDPEYLNVLGDITTSVEMVDEERAKLRETLFFLRSDEPLRIDYILAFDDVEDQEKVEKRRLFEANLKDEGLMLEPEPNTNSVDQKTYYIKLHAPLHVLLTGAEVMCMKKRMKMPKEDMGDSECCGCCHPCVPGPDIIPEEEDFFTAPFSKHRMEMFDIDPRDPQSFFTNSERSLIVREILSRTVYTHKEANETRFGVHKLLSDKVYTSAFPLHEGRCKPEPDDPAPFDGKDKDRARLYEAWARPGRWYCVQPLDLIRKYFGEKVGIYFAWLGFYTTMLIPASVLGVAAFIYGIVTLWDDIPSSDVCDSNGPGNWTMCPMCDKNCDFWSLEKSCLYSRITYVFDNYATVIYATFMSVWATCFLEFWKRMQTALQYDWDTADFELEERMRPEFEFTVKKKKENPITKLKEPYLPLSQQIPRVLTSFSIILFMIALVVAAIVCVVIYRFVIVTVFYQIDPPSWVGGNATLFTSVTAAIINFICILILNLIYKQVALGLTNLETHRTYTEYEDSYTFKMFLFQFVNYYGSIFYIAFFKGRFLTYPGSDDYELFGDFKQDTCDPAGCMSELTIQLVIVMAGKQILNNVKELIFPALKNWCRRRGQIDKETEENLYMRWEQDNSLEQLTNLALFEEYLEMVIQFGFITIFVAAFPLAPLFALLNNIIEIRLDAYKFTTQFQRSPANKAQDIGAWYSILQGIAFIAVLSNGAIIAWTSEFVPRLVYILRYSPDKELNGYVNFTLSSYLVGWYPDDKMPHEAVENGTQYGDDTICRYRGFYDFNTPPPEYTTEFWVVFTARLGLMIVFEHLCFFLTWLVSYLIPDVPSEVKRLQLYERQLVRKTTFDAVFEEAKTTKLHDVVNQHFGQKAGAGSY